jgi:hypothetical protein
MSHKHLTEIATLGSTKGAGILTSAVTLLHKQATMFLAANIQAK